MSNALGAGNPDKQITAISLKCPQITDLTLGVVSCIYQVLLHPRRTVI